MNLAVLARDINAENGAESWKRLRLPLSWIGSIVLVVVLILEPKTRTRTITKKALRFMAAVHSQNQG